MTEFSGTLNPEQEEAVTYTEGPLLILAGAGSGKTRVLTHRAAYLIEHCDVNPWNIMAITFTNKAADEMRERIDKLVGFGAESMWVTTFHSSCARMLRRFADRVPVSGDQGYDTSFTIYDADDAKSVMRGVLKAHALETKELKLKDFFSAVSKCKDNLVTVSDYERSVKDENQARIAKAYREYQKTLQRDNAFDFDDLLMQTVRLLQHDREVRENYQQRFRYIMVDEYQDTNIAQFEFVKVLAAAHKNLCVVGDDDQSIYRFRGANILNILEFESEYPDAKVVKLEQNYRSTKVILDAANEVIANNIGRRKKHLWTETEGGESLHFMITDTAKEEASFIVNDIIRRKTKGKLPYSAFAVLYRTNAQSRLLEEVFVEKSIPYDIVGGINFYQRREIKDILAYLKTIVNPRDDLSFTRIINVPKRGIGATTVSKVSAYAAANDTGFYLALNDADRIVSGKSAEKLKGFCSLIRVLKTIAGEVGVAELIRRVIEQTGYREHVRALCDHDTETEDEYEDRMANLDELISKAVSYEEENDQPTLAGFLEEVALIADIDRVDDNADRVLLMTLHGAKGLEFPVVYIAGMEEELFPTYAATMDFDDHNEAMEEERRLAYVGITRAKEVLTLTSARSRMQRGEIRYHDVSRFVREIPRDLLDDAPKPRKKASDYLFDGGDTIGDDEEFHLPVKKKTVKVSAGKNALQYLQKGIPDIGRVDYGPGDRVMHVRFGEGIVTNIEGDEKDPRVTVNFDTTGVRVMQASFARLKKL